MGRRIVQEHRELRELFDAAHSALEEGPPGRAQTAFVNLRRAVEAHLDREDRLYYPPIHALRDRHRSTLERFTVAHAFFRLHLGDVERQIEAESLDEAQRALAQFFALFARHESEEEALLDTLETEIGATA